MILPWHNKQWQIFRHAVTHSRLPHALLLVGIKGVGKTSFADCLMRSLLCANTTVNGFGCDSCHACRLISGKVHPNVLLIEPENDVIKVDQIRAINDFLSLTSLNGIYRIVVVNSSSTMNINAANALLKILEEPTPNSLLLLLTDNERLPMTIKSRCQRMTFTIPTTEDALTWLRQQSIPKSKEKQIELLLALAQGAPLQALKLIEVDETLQSRQAILNVFGQTKKEMIDPVQAARSLEGIDIKFVIDVGLSWVLDLLRCQHDADASWISNPDWVAQLKTIAKKTARPQLIRLMNYLQQCRTVVMSNLNINKHLMLETIFLRLRECI